MGATASIVKGSALQEEPISISLTREDCDDIAANIMKLVVLVKNERMNWSQAKSLIADTIIRKQLEVTKRRGKNTVFVDAAEEYKQNDGSLSSVVTNQPVSSSSRTLMVAVDGSVAADIAFQSAVNFRKKADYLVAYHAHRDEEHALVNRPITFTKPKIMEKYHSELMKLVPSAYFCLQFYHRLEGQLSIDALCDRLLHSQEHSIRTEMFGGNTQHLIPNVIFLGFSGKRGEMTQQGDLGSVTRSALHCSHVPIFVCKTVLSHGPLRFVFVVDLSDVSQRGLNVLMALLRPRDVLHVVHVSSVHEREHLSEELASAEQFYTQKFVEFGLVQAKFYITAANPENSLAQNLVEAAMELSPNILVLAPRARDSITSVTEQVVVTSPVTVLLCKM